MKGTLDFFRREKVLAISLGAALFTMLLIAPDAEYLGYVDWDVLMLLFSLMAVVGALKGLGVFDRVSRALLQSAGDLRRLTVLLTLACFFFSMLVTNDVALLTFVPLTVLLLGALPDALIYGVTLETIAANLGSMATPIGNPQNLYLYAHYDMAVGDFLRATLPLTVLSLVLLLAACLPVKKRTLEAPEGAFAGASKTIPRGRVLLHAAQFLLCLLAVFKVVPKFACFFAVLATMLVWDQKSLLRVDYALLATFVCFFVFVGNLGRMDAVSALLTRVVAGHELEVGIVASQAISNVPAALMLSTFTQDAAALMRGVDVGGLGTLVASLASLISFKLYMKAPGARAGCFMKVFTGMNVLFLVILYGAAKWI